MFQICNRFMRCNADIPPLKVPACISKMFHCKRLASIAVRRVRCAWSIARDARLCLGLRPHLWQQYTSLSAARGRRLQFLLHGELQVKRSAEMRRCSPQPYARAWLIWFIIVVLLQDQCGLLTYRCSNVTISLSETLVLGPPATVGPASPKLHLSYSL